MEEQPPGEGTSVGDQEESAEACLFNPVPGEEVDKQVPDLIVEGLLQETEEAEEDKEEVKEKETEEMMNIQVEQGGRIEKTLFLNVKDPTDPIDLISTQSFSKMAIKDHKDIERSDQTKKDQNNNKKT